MLLVAGTLSAAGATSAAPWPPPGQPAVIRVAADPNNLPFTNRRLEGFENHIAALIGRELHARIEYEWRAQRRGFFRETLKDGRCDIVLGVPFGFERTLTTSPYYRSSYVFVTRRDRNLDLHSLDDPALPQLTIGVQLIGDDGMNPPPAHSLARRGIVDRVRGFPVYGDYGEPNPPSRIIHAVAAAEIDAALVWGPLAGYFAHRETPALKVTPVSPQVDGGLPLTFAIAVGVRKDSPELRDAIAAVLERRREEIERILDEYNVPRVNAAVEDAHP